jgi:16S rRNA (guanine527-N7)-methyltransferase
VSDLTAALHGGAAQLGVPLAPAQLERFELLVQELLRWNRAYNLTAITNPDEILTHHLLDSLSVHQDLAGLTVADVGTGAGFPGLPLAIVNPERQFTLIDAVDKKLRFIDHVARALSLGNVRTLHGRVEQLNAAEPFDTVIARAFAPLPRLASLVEPLCSARSRVIAMKGHWPEPSGSEGDGEQLSAHWRIESVRQVVVPALSEARNILILRRDGSPRIA